MRVIAATEASVSNVMVTMLSQRRRRMSKKSRGSTGSPVLSVKSEIHILPWPLGERHNSSLARTFTVGWRDFELATLDDGGRGRCGGGSRPTRSGVRRRRGSSRPDRGPSKQYGGPVRD